MPRCLYGAMTLMAFMVILHRDKKKTPVQSGGRLSRGLQARSSVRLFCPGDRGVGGTGKVAKTGLLTPLLLPDWARDDL